MNGPGAWIRGLVWGVVASLMGATLSSTLPALDRQITCRGHNYAHAPVIITHSSVTLAEVYSTPTETVIPGRTTQGSQVRDANHPDLPSAYVLRGEAICRNHSSQAVEAVGLTIVTFDAFHQPLHSLAGLDVPVIKQVVVRIPKGAETRIEWEQPIASNEIYEVAVVVTRVRFADGGVWLAPSEELIDVF